MKSLVAAVQVGSKAFHFDACLDRFAHFLNEARSASVRLVVFPEAFFSAYPRHFAFRIGSRTDEEREWFAKYVRSSVMLPEGVIGVPYSTASQQRSRDERCAYYWRIVDFIRHVNASGSSMDDDGGMYVSVGIVERAFVGSSLFCTNLVFAPDGTLLSRHRKLQPTGAERVVWSQTAAETEDGAGNKVDNLPVVRTPLGNVGGLICWENLQPLWRTAIYQKGVEIYVAPTADGRPTWAPSMQHIAQEGRCFVISANQYHNKDNFPEDYPATGPASTDTTTAWSRGGSVIVDPLGKILAGPLWDQEGLVTAEIDTGLLDGYKLDFDAIGHYSRDDIFELRIKK